MGVSVLMSVYAGADPVHLREALASIYGQTLLPDEVVLMEDGPLTEEQREVIDSFADGNALVVPVVAEEEASAVVRRRDEAARSSGPRAEQKSPLLVIGRFADNVQLGRALAIGVALCANDLIARMDADDVALPDRLAKEVAYLGAHPEVSVLGGAIEEFDGDVVKSTKTIPGGAELLSYAKFRCPVNHMTVMMRRDDILAAGNYRHFPGLEDYELWSRVLTQGYRFDNLPDVLVRARCDSSFYNRRGGEDYGRRYLGLRRMQLESGLLSRGEYVRACAATAMMVYAPPSLRKVFYGILRRKG